MIFMKKAIVSLFVMMSSFLFSQNTIPEKDMNAILDSILLEGNTLYRYEKVAWISTDIAQGKPNVNKDFGGYLVYVLNDTLKTIILNDANDAVIYELVFTKNLNIPDAQISEKRSLTVFENELLSVKKNMIEQIVNGEYNLSCPEGFSLNLILMPVNTTYRLYIITGTSQNDVIPFGNDYLFIADESGKIQTWKKYHSRLIPAYTVLSGDEVVSISHSHLKTEPFISPTDICTFMLYGKLYDLSSFSVYSPYFSKYFTFYIDSNSIKIHE